MRFADLNGDKEINLVNEGPGQEKEVLGSYHYYPFGMRMEGIFHKQDLLTNSYQYNGIDYLSDGSLNVNFATWRTLDPVTGRWWQSDPMADYAPGHSPFNSMWNNPISYSDPNGDFAWGLAIVGAVIGGTITGLSVANNNNLSHAEKALLTLGGTIAGGLLGGYAPDIVNGIGGIFKGSGTVPIAEHSGQAIFASINTASRAVVQVYLKIESSEITTDFVQQGISVANKIWANNGLSGYINYQIVNDATFQTFSYEGIPKPDLGYRILDIEPNAFRNFAGQTDLDSGGSYLYTSQSYINIRHDFIKRNVNNFGFALAHEVAHGLIGRYSRTKGIWEPFTDDRGHLNSVPNLLMHGNFIRKSFARGKFHSYDKLHPAHHFFISFYLRMLSIQQQP